MRVSLGWVVVLAVVLAGCSRSTERSQAESEAPPSSTPAGAEQGGAAPSAQDLGRIGPGDPRLDDVDFLHRLPPSAEVDLALGNAFRRQGKLDSALVYFRHAAEKNPKDPEAWNGVGICLVHLERPEEAKKAFRKAVQADAFFAKTHINLGNLYFKQQDWDRAIDEYRLATSIDSTDTKAWLNLGLAYERVNNVNRAILAYDKAAECDDSDPSPWERLGWIYYEHKMYAAARDRWTEAIKRDPSRTDLADNVRRLQDYADSVGAK